MQRRKPPQPPPPPACSPVTRRRKLAELEPPPVSLDPVMRRKLAELEPPPADRISALPDELLGEIILLLPIRDGARTQAIASRWRHLWRSVPLDLDCCDLVAYKSLFKHSVSSLLISRVLSAHPGPGRRFCVRSLCPVETVDAWLRSPALENLEELDVGGLFFEYVQPLPLSIFRFSATLRVVNIRNCSLSNAAVQGLRFPLLEQLGLEHVHVSEGSLHGLIAGCPALKFLLVLGGTGFRCLRINSLSLKSLCVRMCIDDPDTYAKLHFGEIIVQNAPCLERLIHMYKIWCRHVSVYSAPQVETLDFLTDWQDFATKLVSASEIIPIKGLPVDNLTTALHTVKSLSFSIWDLCLDKVVHLMRLFPCMEKLHLKSEVSKGKNRCCRKHQKFVRSHDIRLKTLVLEPFLDTLSHVNFATFFVLNARALELMEFRIEAKLYNSEFLSEQHRKLQLENKASKGARFHFTTASCQHAVWRTKHPRDFDFNDPFLRGC